MINKILQNRKSSILILLVFFSFLGNRVGAQEDKKNASLSVQYFKVMNENSYLNITAKYKDKNGFEPCKNLALTVYTIDTTGVKPDVKIGLIKTNKDGKSKFIIPINAISEVTSYSVKLENNAIFEDNDEGITVTNSHVEASIEKTDRIYTINARLLSSDNKPIADETLKVGLKRLFGNLFIGGEDSYTTDENGAVSVEIDKGLTGLDRKLNFQVVVDESEKYGSVVANLNANFGLPIVDKSSFNERTMWSPPTKTPWFLLIIPNVILVGIWSILTLLLFNLFKIYKSKN